MSAVLITSANTFCVTPSQVTSTSQDQSADAPLHALTQLPGGVSWCHRVLRKPGVDCTAGQEGFSLRMQPGGVVLQSVSSLAGAPVSACPGPQPADRASHSPSGSGFWAQGLLAGLVPAHSVKSPMIHTMIVAMHNRSLSLSRSVWSVKGEWRAQPELWKRVSNSFFGPARHI
jgi:hypothetical protein